MAGTVFSVLLLYISIFALELRIVSTNFQTIAQTDSYLTQDQANATSIYQLSRNDSYGHSPEQGGSFYKPSHYYQVVPPIESETTNISKSNFRAPFIIGLRVEESDKPVAYDEENVPIVQAGTFMTVRLFGDDLNEESQFRFVVEARERGADCDDLPFTVTVNSLKESLTGFSSRVTLRLPSFDHLSQAHPVDYQESLPAFYVCSLQVTDDRPRWIHQGKEPGVKLRTYRQVLPLWLQIVIIALLLSFSGLFSGLNLGLMALDRTELKIYMNTGSEKEKGYARAIIPVRNHGNYLLCTLLLGNVLVNSTLTILLDELTSGLVAVIGSTVGIVILGEIVPQAICSRHGLAIGAHTVWITKFFMLVTFPMSYPISLLLNVILGEEIGAYYNRERLKELIKVTNEYHDLEKEEVNIISGALEMRRKTVGDVMTHLEDVFMLSYDSLLDFETVSEILKQGFSRVPVYDGERTHIVGLLFIKELALVDPEDAIPLKTLCKFYQKQCHFVFDDTTLDVVFKDFKDGSKGHMAIVQRVNNKGQCDPFYETVGLVTLEDVIEELIQAEIVDETDVWLDNRSKRRRDKNKLLQDFSSFAIPYRPQTSPKISPQLSLSAFQFLSSSVDAFHSRWISENVLRRLVQQGPVIECLRLKNKDKSDCDPDPLIYEQGKPVDYFVLILEGRVEVTVGKECLVFEAGPFSHYGSHALNKLQTEESRSSFNGFNPSHRAFSISEGSVSADSQARSLSPTFISDYTVRALTDVTYLRVSRFLYQAARSATFLERAQSVDTVDSQSTAGDLQHHSFFIQQSVCQSSKRDSEIDPQTNNYMPRECQQTNLHEEITDQHGLVNNIKQRDTTE